MDTKWNVTITQTTEQEKIIDLNDVENRMVVIMCQPYQERYIELVVTKGRNAARDYLNNMMPMFARCVDSMLCDNGVRLEKGV